MEHSRLRVKFHVLIEHAFQMMFVSGETADVAPETTSMIEFIVQQQVMEMVCLLVMLPKITHTDTTLSSLAQPSSRRDEVYAQSAQTTSSSSSDMTEPKSAGFAHFCPGKMSEKAPKTATTKVALMPRRTTLI